MCKCGNIVSCQGDCGCKFEVNAGCVRYTGETLDSIGAIEGSTLEVILEELNKKFSITESASYLDVSEESPGTNCEFGGVKIQLKDRTTNAVITTEYVCAPNASSAPCITIIDILHEDLKILISEAKLEKGQKYRITDFQTIYDQPDYDSDKIAKTTVLTKEGPIEPIIVLALTDSVLSTQAYQEDHPKDIVEYILDFTTPVNNIETKGRIIYRKDEWGNETDFDHRNVLFKRYDNIDGHPVIHFDNGGYVTENPIFSFITLNESSNNIALGYFSNPNRDVFDLPNIVLTGKAQNNYFSNSCYNLTLYSSNIKSNIFKGDSNGSFVTTYSEPIENNTLSNFVNNSFYHGEFASNILDDCRDNTFSTSYFTGNTINYMRNNNVIGDFEGNKLYSMRDNNIDIVDFSNNKLNRFFGNTITSLGEAPDTSSKFKNNIGSDIYNSTFKGFEYAYIHNIDDCIFNSDVAKLIINCSLQSIDFTSSTVVYKTESKEINLAESDNYSISYFDQYGAKILNDINI